MTVKLLAVDYEKVNERGVFSPGDVLSGKVTLVTSKEIKAQCFSVKAKGRAKVTWCEREGRSGVVHSDKKRYFHLEHIILQDKNKGDGRDMPSSYDGKWGNVTYSVRAKLTQSIWLVHKAGTDFPFLTKSEFPFASKTEMMIIGLKEQQQATRISFYGSEKITINVTSEKMGVKQGDALGVSLEVVNDSARTVTPRFYLCEKQTFAAQSARVVHTDNFLFGTGECVPAQASRTVTMVLSVPPDLPPTFFNCCLMKLEYRLKVLLPTQTEL
ncbi:hypothetical protein D4764_05G0001400 [Takifugu flavidus]|uniref:Arrestin C-terminal-like domain-containing protein n=1 Tax=Takifugu flavidus TaxID=433684 RepID=A0A5C6N2Y3_9TELE|nr:hypothetical protein D4764_05G0001400 [Takifugu flavidus]